MSSPSGLTNRANTSQMIPEKGFLADYCRLYTPMSEAPAEAHLATALAVMSAAIGWRAYIRWGESSEPCTLFIMLEGGSATAKKTTTAKTGASLIRHAVRLIGDESDRPPLAVRSISHTSRRGLLELVGTDDAETARAWEHGYPPGILLDWDEFGTVLGKPGEVKGSGQMGDIRAGLMEMYGGRHGGVQIGALKLKPSRCAVAILATMTRKELEQRLSSGLLRDGFMGRFVLMPHPGRQRYMAVPPTWTSHDAAERDRLAEFLMRVTTSKQEMGDVFRRLSPTALEMRREWYNATMRRLDLAAEHGGEAEAAQLDAMGRLQTTAMKVAAVAAVCEMEDGEDLGEVLIDARHIEYGIALAEHALKEVDDLAGESGHELDRYGKKVLAYLAKRNGLGPMNRAALLSAVKQDGLDRATCWKVVESLHRDGLLWISVNKTTGGRPSQEVEAIVKRRV